MTRFGSIRMLFIVGLTLACIVILFYLMIDFSWQKYQQYDDRIAQLEPKTSRLLGVEQSYDVLLDANKQIQSQLSTLTYPASKNAATVGALMQRKVREIMGKSNMAVTGSQILPFKRREGYDKIGLDITITGTMESFENVLNRLAALQPSIIVESINVKPIKARRNEPSTQKISARFKLLSLRLQS